MKKLSLIIACGGIISIAAYGSGFHGLTNPQEDSKKKENTGNK